MQCCTWRRPGARVAATLPANSVGERVDIYLRPRIYVRRIAAAPDYFYIFHGLSRAITPGNEFGTGDVQDDAFHTRVGNELLHMAGEKNTSGHSFHACATDVTGFEP